MRRIYSIALVVYMACMFGWSYGAEGLAGFYKTHVGSDGRQAIVEFFYKDGKYYAYGFANVDGSPPKKDSNNKNPALRDRYDRGTIFVYGLEGEGEKYGGGKVYDFHNGEIYYAKVRLNGDTLTLHGSVDKSGMIGVDKVWTRLSNEEVRPYLHLKPSMQDVLKTLKDWQQ